MFKTKISQQNLWRVLYVISSIGMCVAVLSRDVRLQSFLINPQDTPEFSVSNLLCNDFPRCGRISGELFGISILAVFNLSAMLFNNNSFWKNYYTSNEDFLFLINNAGSLTYRLICLIPILILCYRLVGKSPKSMSLILASFSILVSGMPLYYINNLFGIYLVNYDYMVIFVLGILLLNVEAIFKSQTRILLFTFLLTLTFENLPLIIMIIIFRRVVDIKDRNKLLIYVFLTSTFTYLAYLLFVITRNEFQISIESDGRYLSKNLLNFIEITGAIFLFLVVAFMLGALVSYFLGNTKNNRSHQNFTSLRLTGLLISVLYAYCFSVIIGFFISGLTEFARQLIPLQVALFILGLSGSINLNRLFSKFTFFSFK